MPYPANTALYGPRQDLLGALASSAPNQNYAANKWLPPLQVFTREGRFAKVLTGKAYRSIKTKRAAGGPFARGSTPLDSATFLCEERGFEEAVDRLNKAIYRTMLDQEKVAARTCYNVVMIDHEVDVAAMLYNETTFPASGTTGLTVSVPWSTAATCTPIADVMAGKNAIIAKVGPGKFQFGANDKVIRNIWKSTDVRNQMIYGYGRPIDGEPKLDVLAQVLGVDEVVVHEACYNSAKPNATVSMARIWSDTYAFLGRVDTNEVLDRPQLGRTFVNSVSYDQSNRADIVVGDEMDPRIFMQMYPEDNTDADVIRCREFTDEVVMDSSCGFLFKTVT